jgi:adenine-specific DNA-methyltransferase
MPQLIWDGKFDDNGKRTPVPKLALPFQTVETVNEDTRARLRSLNLFEEGSPGDWRNRLIWGDKKWVLPSLLPEFGAQVDLIYIDPPFDTGADFSFTAQIPDDPETPGDQSASFTKEPSLLELKAYRDIWGGAKTHLDAYLKWFYETVVVLYDLLSPTGSIYVHVGRAVSQPVKLILDEMFSPENFINEITWKRSHAHSDAGQGAVHYGRVSESIFFYTKSEKATWNPQYTNYTDEILARDYKYTESDGRKYRLTPVDGPGGATKGNPFYEFLGVKGYWRYSEARMKELYEAGEIVLSSTGKSLSRKKYLESAKGTPVVDLWDDVNRVSPTSNERVGYPTQKPEALLERIIRASSNPGDLVLDCFCGSGTTAAVAEKLKRRWITCDLGRFAIHTARKRLLAVPELKPFQIQNLGKYERQAWRTSALDDPGALAEHGKLLAYRKFILDLYHASPMEGYVWLHGVKNGRYVHVGSIDSPISEGDITQIALEWKRATGGASESPLSNGIDVLGWEFAFELNDIKKQQAERANLSLALKRIPREIMEKRAADSGEIQFFELAALELGHLLQGKTLALRLEGFIAPPDYLPHDVQSQITHWEQLVDYWAIDFDFQGDAFHNGWQSYRTKSRKTLERIAHFTYDSPGKKRVVVKVIDILGNDTTKMVEVVV